ncbi:hypothetical protein ALC57_17826 [Trachymyrmex cornetzi]|uniref:Uncharacterized protein n=1 Tax=Trachymyrmex cornetzi TaxID=471704 RepID=A0A151ISZ0_9HYME|nr:hypothetical protein ALC57_17826 [Trachymyrmex cornetzi]
MEQRVCINFCVKNLVTKHGKLKRPMKGRRFATIEEIKAAIDFQLCVYTTPVLDLIYFLNTSPSLDIMENKKNILLNEYFDTLSVTMKQLNCKTQPLTMEELKVTIKRKASYEMIVFFVILPFLLCSKAEAKDLDELSSDGNPGVKSENFRKLMIKRLPLYDEWGLLDLLTYTLCWLLLNG